MLTPLIAYKLRPRISAISGAAIRSQSGMMSEVLEAVLQKEGLPAVNDPSGRPIDSKAWGDAAAIVAWVLFSEFRSECHIRSELVPAIKRLRRSWETIRKAPQSDDAVRIAGAFHLLGRKKHRDRLLRSSVFVPTGGGKFGYMHMVWEEYLVSRYIVRCLLLNRVDDLHQRALTRRIFTYVGEIWSMRRLDNRPHEATEGLVKAVIEEAKTSGDQFVLGNFAALVMYSIMPISFQVTKKFLADSFEITRGKMIEEVALHIVVGATGYRAYRHDPADRSCEDLCRAYVEKCSLWLNAVESNTNAVTRSLAWCYLKVFGGDQAIQELGPWPGLGVEHESSVLRMVCDRTETGYDYTTKQRSLQWGFLSSLRDIGEPSYAISASHYVYILAVAKKYGGHIPEVTKGLAHALAPGAITRTTIEGCGDVPELRQILNYCDEILRRQ